MSQEAGENLLLEAGTSSADSAVQCKIFII